MGGCVADWARWRASQARRSAWPRGKAATASFAARQDWGDVAVSGSGAWDAKAGWASGAVGAATWAASAAGAGGLLGVGAMPWASESSGASSTRPMVRGGDEDEYGNEAEAHMAISRQRAKKDCAASRPASVSKGLRPWQTHFGRWRSGDGWFDGQCGRRIVKLCRRGGQHSAQAAVDAGRCQGGVEHCRMADLAGGASASVVVVCGTPWRRAVARGYFLSSAVR